MDYMNGGRLGHQKDHILFPNFGIFIECKDSNMAIDSVTARSVQFTKSYLLYSGANLSIAATATVGFIVI